MAGAAFGDGGNGKRAHLYEYRITGYFIFACVVAALGGSLFGYDLGVSGEFFLHSSAFVIAFSRFSDLGSVNSVVLSIDYVQCFKNR